MVFYLHVGCISVAASFHQERTFVAIKLVQRSYFLLKFLAR